MSEGHDEDAVCEGKQQDSIVRREGEESRLAPTMCVGAGDLVGDVEDEGGEEGQRRYSIPSSATKFILDRMIIDAPGNDSPSLLRDPSCVGGH